MFDLKAIQDFLKKEKLDGWLLADFHGRNTLMIEFLELGGHITRRNFYFIPSDGEPTGLIHNIERDRFTQVPGNKIYFTPYRDLEEHLKKLLAGKNRVAMEYSPNNRLPYIGLADAGTIELVRSFGVEVVSSADIIGNFKARLDEAQVESHKKAAFIVNGIKDKAFAYIAESLKSGKAINERMVVEFIEREFESEGMIRDFGPIVAVEKNISNPHYDPPEHGSSKIEPNQLVLIDLWAKFDLDNAVYADMTWMAFTGKEVPAEYAKEFSIVTGGRDAAVQFLRDNIGKSAVFGYEADDACRNSIAEAGFGKYFFHRTGHSIASEVHGPGPNIDNMETEDRRRLLPGHLFSVEPGIYLGPRGYRSEIDVLITENGPEVTTQPMQTEIIPLLA